MIIFQHDSVFVKSIGLYFANTTVTVAFMQICTRGANQGFSMGGGGGGGEQEIMRAHSHHEREARCPLWPGKPLNSLTR